MVAIVVAWAVLAMAPAARADGARPTAYESVVTALSPDAGWVTAWVTGGDAFLWVEVAPGHRLEVPGYQGEPYLVVDTDGVVSRNRASPATFLNDDRFGRVELPQGVGVDAEPRWEVVGSGGRYGWHDHRIHWMSPGTPPWIDGDRLQTVWDWTVPMALDGDDLEVSGTLSWSPPVSAVPWVSVALAVGVVAHLLGAKGVGARGALVVVAASAAAVVAVPTWRATPAGAESVLLAIGPLAAAWLLGLLSWLRRRGAIADAPALLGAILVLVWGALRGATLWAPVLVSGLPPTLERVVVAVSLGLAAGTISATLTARPTPGDGGSLRLP